MFNYNKNIHQKRSETSVSINGFHDISIIFIPAQHRRIVEITKPINLQE